MSHPAPASRELLRGIAHRAMRERGLLPDFSAATLAEVRALDAAPADPTARDLRALAWASIDNDDSRDLDQLSASEDLPGGDVRVLVAIADVDASVRPGSALDGHARANTTSVYTAAQIFPMLPERLSTDLTSLNQEENRLAVVVEWTVSPNGATRGSALYQATVRNRAKLAYDAVAAWLDGAAPPPPALAALPGLEVALRSQDRAAQAMRGQRTRRGALTLETAEARPVFDGGVLTDLRKDERNRAKELIEDLMIAANGFVAGFLDGQGLPSIRRVLRVPERWPRIVELAAASGEELPEAANARALESFLTRRRKADPVHFPDLSLAVVKLLGSGEYALESPGRRTDGHFGLAVQDYTHSTAPNRRYPDLVTQRMVKAALEGRAPPYGEGELEALARRCTECEGKAAKVERQVRKSAAALLLQNRRGERFQGIVTGASVKGTWVRIERPPVEGRVVSGFDGLDAGDQVTVKLVRTDVERGFIDFER